MKKRWLICADGIFHVLKSTFISSNMNEISMNGMTTFVNMFLVSRQKYQNMIIWLNTRVLLANKSTSTFHTSLQCSTQIKKSASTKEELGRQYYFYQNETVSHNYGIGDGRKFSRKIDVPKNISPIWMKRKKSLGDSPVVKTRMTKVHKFPWYWFLKVHVISDWATIKE